MTLVIDGLVVIDEIYEELKTNKPRNLTGKLEIGRDWAGGMWRESMGILTELNIFKGALSKQEMAKMTSFEHCLPPGEYDICILLQFQSNFHICFIFLSK